MDNIDKFLNLFSEFNLVIEPRIKKTQKKSESKSTPTTINRSILDLKKTLSRLTKEYKQARRSFKHHKISRQELFDFEWRIFEIQEELRRIQDRERNSD